jgi:hypothetical protein
VPSKSVAARAGRNKWRVSVFMVGEEYVESMIHGYVRRTCETRLFL